LTDLREKYGEWALITGAARRYGLGEAFARRLAADKVNLVLVDILETELQERAQELERDYGVSVRPVVQNLGQDDTIVHLAAATADIEIGILVCNHYFLVPGPFLAIRPEDHIRMLNANARAYMLLVHHFGGAMAERGKGGIVMVASLVALMPIPYNVHYSSFKAYILAMAEALGGEFKESGVDIIGLVAPFMNTADARDTDFPPSILDRTDRVARAAFRKLGRRSRVLPSWRSKIFLFVFTCLMRRTKGLWGASEKWSGAV
jgi:short-subunit dehydrogenase